MLLKMKILQMLILALALASCKPTIPKVKAKTFIDSFEAYSLMNSDWTPNGSREFSNITSDGHIDSNIKGEIEFINDQSPHKYSISELKKYFSSAPNFKELNKLKNGVEYNATYGDILSYEGTIKIKSTQTGNKIKIEYDITEKQK